ncbi:MAG: hypothetical protein M3081_12800 [Gemmatimonadota bacterium]|nr:hypothetical protein [Gemmatimonadota bacterium]
MTNDDELRESIAPLIEMRDITMPRILPEPKEKASSMLPPEPTDEPDDSFPEPRYTPSGVDRSACPAPDLLTDLVRREGGEAERSRTAEHLRECQHCRTDLNMLRVSASKPVEASSLDFELKTLIMPGVGVVVLALAIWGFLSRGNNKPARVAPAAAASANAPQSAHPVGRSSGMPDPIPPPVVLIEPALGAHVQRPVTLTWHAIPDAMRYRVEVLDHGNWSAYTVTTQDTSITLPAKSRLRPRRPYRWWVQATLSDGTHQRSAPRAMRILP